jgi:hypothetical protein
MLCGTAAAERCIKSFDGVALFADQSAYNAANSESNCLMAFDYNIRSIFPSLTVWSYYLLVVFSFTGICTLFGQTRLLKVADDLDAPFNEEETNEGVSSEVAENLRIPPKVIEYIRNRSKNLATSAAAPVKLDDQKADVDNDAVVLKRRFEFDFGGFLTVMMLHFVCSQRKTHLVEVYRFEKLSVVGLVVSLFVKPLSLWRQMSIKKKTSNKRED